MLRIDLAEYELHERLGTGTVGSIFLAKHIATGAQRAVKFLTPAASANPLIVSRFSREMLILEKLNHPNILAYFGGGKHDEQLFFVMEYVRGGTLKDLMERSGPLTWKEAAESGRQIAAALQHAHNHGIIHRDLKPGNVFVTETGQLKLGDFGIARDAHAQSITDAGLTVGTYSYMAPELIRGEQAITGQVDLYALGCLLFELLVGRTPFVGDNFAQIFDQHLKSAPPEVTAYVPDCPPALSDLIGQLLAKAAEDRPFNARAVQGKLSDLLDPTSVPVSEEDDRGAGEIRPAQQMLAERIKLTPASRMDQVTWGKLGWCLAAILAVILAAVLWNR